jgi:hypothetical protein
MDGRTDGQLNEKNKGGVSITPTQPKRSGCWSITINNPTEEELRFDRVEPNGWFMKGQLERGKNGTDHYQGCLITPQKPAFSTVKKVFPRAHIEAARARDQLMKYVEKDDTRIAEVPSVGTIIPTLFEYQTKVAVELDIEVIQKDIIENIDDDEGDIVIKHVNKVVKRHIEQGMRGVEFIAINPMWICSWKRFWRSIIKRDGKTIWKSPQDDGKVFRV